MILKRFLHLSLRTRLALLIVLVSFVSIMVVGIITYFKTKQILTHDATEKLILQAQLQSAFFEKEIQQVKGHEQGIEAILRSHLRQFHHLDSSNIQTMKDLIMPELLEYGKLSGALSMWIVFNPQFIKGAHTISFIDKNGNGHYEREREFDISKANLESDEYRWWTDALKDGETWTKPYYWKNWDKSLVTYSKAVFVDGEFVACVGSDFDFSALQKDWSAVKILKSGYILLTDQNYNTIVHPSGTTKNAKELLPPKTFELFSNTLRASKAGMMPTLDGNENRMLAFNHLSNGWLMMAVVPVNEILSPLETIKRVGLVLFLTAVLISLGLSYLLSKKHYKPILDLIKLMDKSSLGELHHRWKGTAIKEFNHLGMHFNEFMTQMQLMITRLNDQQVELTAALKKSKESDDLKSAFLGNLSHEIRTPLYAITGFSSLLNSDDLTVEDRQNFTQIVHRNNDILLKFVDNIMIFSQLEQNQLQANILPVSINSVAEDIYQNFHERYYSSHKQIIWNRPDFDANQLVSLDVNLFRIAAEMIIDNAWKFTHEGFINVGFQLEDLSFSFYVEDSGIGVPSDYHSVIFNKFFKYKDIDDKMIYGGVGMGLSIAKGITELMNGKIEVTSELGTGSRFEMKFLVVQ